MIGTAGTPVQGEDNRLAFLRYLPRRIADFERRILRYRFAGWDPKGMTVLSGDARRLADASANYGLGETREHLLALAQMVGGHVSSMRGPDPKQAERMFALLSAVLRSLPEAAPRQLPATVDEQAQAEPSRAMTDAERSEAARSDAAPPSGLEEHVAEAATASGTAGSGSFVESMDEAAGIEEPSPVDVRDEAIEAAATGVFADVAAPPMEVEPAHMPASPESVPPVAPAGTFESSGQETAGPAPSASLSPGLSVEPTAMEMAVEPDAALAIECEPIPEGEAPTVSTDTVEWVEPGVMPIAPGTQVEHAKQEAGTDTRESLASIEIDDAEEPESVGSVGMRRIFHLSDGNPFAVELGQRLESEGFAIEPVENVDELSELLTCLMPHMLLVDASHASRLAIVGALRRDAQQQSLPPRHIQMIVMAADDSVDMRRGAYRAGADLLLFPPFDVAGVSDRLHALHSATAAEPVRVLVVDDERADALFAQAVLNRAGMRARVVHDPMRVIEALASERADLILMDLHMPFANGVEVTMLLRDDPQFARIPIVFLSGESDPDSRLEAINAGGDDFLFKPIRPRHLVTAVQDRVRRLHAVEKPG